MEACTRLPDNDSSCHAMRTSACLVISYMALDPTQTCLSIDAHFCLLLEKIGYGQIYVHGALTSNLRFTSAGVCWSSHSNGMEACGYIPQSATAAHMGTTT